MIRIIPDPSQRRAALLSLGVAGGAAVLMISGWFAVSSPAAAVAYQRSFQETPLSWRCAQGHVFIGFGSFPAPTCPHCHTASHALIAYHCPRHGATKLEVRFSDADRSDHPAPVAVRNPGDGWSPVSDYVRCPACGAVLGSAPFEWNAADRG